MSGIPGAVDTEYQPPMAVPLRHFVVGVGLLLVGGLLGLGGVLGLGGGAVALAHVHALVLGWVGLTIAGAMTQFVPVWSGTRLHSRRLARLQLLLLSLGVAGFLAVLVAGRPALLPAPGAVVVLGFWTFAYNVGRTLLGARPLDVTERHFAFALACVLVVTGVGFVLALDFSRGLLSASLRQRLVSAHATLAVFGFVLATVAGASYQLVSMFTQTEIEGAAATLRRVETAGYPLGVALFAGGRLLGNIHLVRIGGALVVLGLAALAAVVGQCLLASQVEWTPMLRRYAAFAAVLLCWCGLTLPVWLARPLASAARFGAPGAAHLLFLGVVGAIVSGTLYHVVPFIVWVHRYSARLGFEDVPMIDDLYDDRLAGADLLAVSVGSALLVAPTVAGGAGVITPVPVGGAELLARAAPLGGALVLVGFGLFAANLLGVVYRHAPAVISERLAAADGEPDSPQRG